MSDSVALVTGANRGIGLEVCRQLAQQGKTVYLAARTRDRADAAAHTLSEEGLSVLPLTLDVTVSETIAGAVQTVEAAFGRLDILVNNAAVFTDWSETATNADLGIAHAVLETNLFGAWRVIQMFLPLLKHSPHPRIVNVSSGAGSHGDSQFGLTTGQGSVASYGISKAALNALTSKFAAELAGTGILVNAVCPGFTATAPGMEAMGARPVAESAVGIVWAATLPDDGANGGFFRDGKPLPW